MIQLPSIRGLKYPDEAVVRHFFKARLDSRPGRAVELGGGTGNNLSLYKSYGWRVTNVDRDARALADAAHNLGEEAEIVEADLSAGPPPLSGPIDALLIPNMLCYVSAAQAERLLSGVAPLMAPGCAVFVRTRARDDYRYARGRETEPHGFILDTEETGEAGAFNLFYDESALTDLLKRTLGLEPTALLRIRFDNIQSGRLVPGNSDIVVWGQRRS
ncbi:class I SAM-dependent methyltransferase [Caulobacter sp. 73W]|uniref:Class I SAM-dependent methyltransferase n=1 Tax=Caulobacter sp. 73W TaxID=3161137 RepID=A0AB39KQM1_9CAUL